ncbi:MAG: cadherin domain-containing protein [Fuerstiella sp.]
MTLRKFIHRTQLLLQEGLYESRRALSSVDAATLRPLDVTQLEERILMSASPLAVVAEAAADTNTAPTEATEYADDGQLSDQQLLDVVANEVLPQQSGAIDADTGHADDSADTVTGRKTLELVFIDSTVSNLDQMIADLQAENGLDDSRTLEVVVLDAEKNGIAQITSALLAYNGIDGIHIVSHGSDGQVQLGATALSLDNLDTYRSAISAWQYSLSDEADVLFYGCNLAATADGRELMHQIAAESTGDVAASDDNTGHAALGGDWDLEYSAGDIETGVAFSQQLQDNWSGLLNVTVDATSTGTSNGNNFLVSHTTSGTDRLMLVGISINEASDESVTSVTYNGVALSFVGASENGDARVEIWSLVNPNTGTHDVNIDFSGNTDGNTAGVMTFNGVDQATALGTFAPGAGGSGGTGSATVTSAAGELVFAAIAVDEVSDYDLVPGTGQTEHWDLLGGSDINGGGSTKAGAASVPMSWTWSGSDAWAVGGVSIKPANAAPVLSFAGGTANVPENYGPYFLSPSATVTDADSADFNGGQMVVTLTANAAAEDQLTVRNQGSGAGQVGISGSNVTYGGTVVGTFNGPVTGSTPLTITFNNNATAAIVQAVARNVTYENTSENPSTATRTVEGYVTDGDGGTSNVTSGTINNLPVNDAPVVGAPGAPLAAVEQVGLAIHGTGFTVSDVDEAGGTVVGTLSVSQGEITVAAGNSGVSILIGNGSNSVTLSGTVAQIDNLLTGAGTGTITYLNNRQNPSPSATFTVAVNDSGNTGSDPGTSGGPSDEEGTNSVLINITAMNDAPVVGAPAGPLATTENVSLAIHGTGFTVSDADESDAGATATLSVDEGTITVAAGDSGVSVTGGNGTGTVTLSGTIAQIDDLLTAAGTGTITFNSSDASSGSATFTVTVNDAGNMGDDPGTSGGVADEEGTNNVAINISRINDTPVVGAPGSALAAVEQVGLAIHGTGFTVSDVDAVSGTVTATLTVGEGTITVAAGNSGVTIAGGNGTGTVTLTGTVAQIDNLLTAAGTGTVTYLNSSDTPGASTTFTVTLNDQGNTGTDPGLTGDGSSEEDSNNVTVNITAMNDAPVVAAPGGPLAATENVGLAIHGTGFSVGDVDEAGAGATATLSVNEGSITVVAGNSGVTITGGNGTGTVTLSGTISQLDNLLTAAGTGTITFDTGDASSGSATFTVTVNDAGNTGDDPGSSGGVADEEGTNNVTINVSRINDTPVVTAPGSALVAVEQVGLAIHGTGFAVSDADAASGMVTTMLTVGEGTITVVAGSSGVTIASGNGTGTVTLNGTVAQIDNLLTAAGTGTVTYLNSSDTPGASTTLTVTLNDQGNTGTDPGLTGDGSSEEDSNNVTINITAMNDAPVVAAPAAPLATTEHVSLAIHGTGFSVSDVDEAGAGATATLSVDEGTITVVAGNSGVTITGGNGTGSVSLSGTIAQIDNLLTAAGTGTITYLNNSDAPGASATFTVTVNDAGNTGDDPGTSGGVADEEAANNVTISITAINDDPVISLPGGAVNYTEGDGAVVVDVAGTVSDVDLVDLDTGTLAVDFTANSTANDRLSVNNEGTGAGQVGVSGSDVTYEGVTIGTFSGGTDGSTPLVITFNANCSATAAQALLRNITYENVSNDPDTLSRTVRFVLTDGDGGTSNTETETINITSLNDVPIVDLNGADGGGNDYSTTFTEGDAPVTVTDTDATITDADGNVYNSLTVTLAGAVDEMDERVRFGGQEFKASEASTKVATVGGTSFQITSDGTTFVITRDGGGLMPAADQQLLVRSITYENLDISPTDGNRTFTFVAQDAAGADSTVSASTINVVSVNQVPAITVPGSAVSYTENDAATIIDATATASDVDSADFDGGTLTVDFTANGHSGDRLSINDEGTGVGQIGLSGPNVTYEGTTIGTVAGGTDGSTPLVITFNASSTPTAAQALIRNITYQNISDDPGAATRTARFVLTDGDGGTSNAATIDINVSAVNDAPTMTSFAAVVETTSEDSEVEISFADLATQGDEADVDGTVDAFIVKSVASGTLKIGTSAGAATAWAAGTNDTIDATNHAYWTPDTDVTGTQNAFDVVAKDDQAAESVSNITAQIAVTSVNDPPTLTSFASVVETTNEDTEVEISFADLATQGDEADVDGTVDAFVVKNLTSGTLKIGTSAGTATAWAASTNDTINATNHAYWTPDADVNGTQSAFDVVAKDNQGAESAGNITAQVSVTAVNDPPTLTSFAAVVETTGEDTEVEISFADLAAQGDEADIDGTVDAFVVRNLTSGTLKIGTSAGTATSWAAGTNDTIDATNHAYWTPAADVNGLQNAFDVVAQDNLGAESVSNITTQVSVTSTNDPPTLTSFVAVVETTNEDTEVEISFADLAAQGDEADVDGTVDAFVVKSVASGTLKIGTSAGTATAWAAGTNDTIDATNHAYWTPAADVNGTQNAFDVVAEDDQGAESSGNITAQVAVTSVNDAPTLTGFSAVVETTSEDTEVEISFADLAAQGDEADVDGTVDAFVVQSIASGTLKIGTSAGTATAWAAGTNDTIDATNHAYWTPDADVNGTQNAFAVVAEDNQSTESVSNITAQVSVASVNDDPTVTSDGGGPTAAISVGENNTAVTTVTSSDVDGGSPVYSITGGADAAAFSIDASTGALNFVSSPDFETPADVGGDNIYNVTVHVSDGAGGTDTQDISVTVTDVNDDPVFTSAALVNVPENQSFVTTVAATDDDLPAQTVEYSITGGADSTMFALNPTTGDLVFISPRNFEAPTDTNSDNVYEVNITATDGNGGVTVQAMQVTVTDENDNTPVITPGQSLFVDEDAADGTSLGTVAAADADAVGTLQNWTITFDSSGGIFAIDAVTGELTVADNSSLDYESTTAYTLFVRVDDGVNTSAQESVTINVNPVSESAPIITSDGGGASAAVNVAENATVVTTVTATDADLPAETLTFSISGGADAAKFAIDSASGVLTFITAPDFEAPTDGGLDNVYDVVVEVSDGTLSDTQTLAVTVTPVNDNTPAITSDGGGASAAVSVAENETAVTTVTATDADLPAQTLSYTIVGGADAAKFGIDGSSGALTFISAPDYETPTDVGTDNVYDVIVEVSDGTLTDTQSIAVTVTGISDHAPIITSNGGGVTAVVNVAENSTAVANVTASDADLPAETLTYSIAGGADAASFTIDAVTGLLRFVTAPDYETPTDVGTDNVYNVTVQVSDGTLSDTQAIAVTVTDGNTAPVLDNTRSPSLTDISEDAGLPAGAVGTLVSQLADATSPAGQLDNVTDSDVGALLGIAVTAADTSNGQWHYSTDNGASWNALGSVSDSNARLLAADASTRLYFQPNADYFGTLSNAITFRAWDQTSGSNGGTADTTSSVETYRDNFTVASYDNDDGTLNWSTDWIENDVGPGGPTNGRFFVSGGRLNVGEAGSGRNIFREADLSAATTATYSFNLATNNLGGGGSIAVQVSGNGGSSWTTLLTVTDATSTGTKSFDITSFIAVDTQIRFYDNNGGGSEILIDDVQISVTTPNTGGSTAFSSATDAASLVVNPVADTPSVTNAATDEDTQTTSGLVISRHGADAAEVTHFKITGISNGTLYQNDGTTQITDGSFITFPEGNAGLKFTPAANFNGTTTFTIQASTSGADAGLGGSTATATITVNPLNDAPAITPIADQTIAEDTSTGALAFSVTDAETAAGSLIVTAVSSNTTIIPNSNLTLVDLGGGNWTIEAAPDTNQTGGPVTITVTVDDGTTTSNETFAVTVTAANDAPSITAIADQTIAEDTTTGAIAFSVSDAETAAGSLTVTASSSNTTLIPDGNLTLVDLGSGNWTIEAAPAADQFGGPVTITVTVHDGTTGTDETFDVTVTPVNDAPTGNVTISGTSTEDQILTADTSGISDADGLGTFSYQWRRDGVAITGATADTWTLSDADVGTQLSVQVSYTDGNGTPEGPLTSAATAPIANINDEQTLVTNVGLTVNEGQAGVVITQAMLETTDADHSAAQLTYTLTAVPSTGTLQLNGTPLTAGSTFTQADINAGRLTYSHNDAEIFSDGFGFTVDDGAGTVTGNSFAVTILPVNDHDPVVTSNGGGSTASVSVAENTSGVTTVTATDADQPAQSLSFAIAGGIDAGRFSIDAGTGNLSFAAAPDFESPTDAGADNIYQVIVEVADGQGRTAQQTILISVTDVNEYAVSAVSDADAAANEVVENSANGVTTGITALATDADATNNTISWSLDDDAGGRFTIDSASGIVTVADGTLLDREASASHDIIVRATSSDTSFSTAVMTIAVTDLNDNPPDIVPSQTFTVSEHAGVGTSLGNILATDADVVGTLQNWTITAGNTDGIFTIDPNTGELTVADATSLNFETTPGYTLTLTVDDGFHASTPRIVSVAVLDQNEAPIALNDQVAGDQLKSLVVPAGVLTANDFDVDGDPLSVVLAAGPASGTLILNADGAFTYTPNGSFSGQDSFTYYATDGSLNSAPATVQIDITTTLTGTGGSTGTTPDSETGTESPTKVAPPAENSSTENSSTESDADEANTERSDSDGAAKSRATVAPVVTAASEDADAEFAASGSETKADAAIRRASAEAVVAVFLDAIPESEVSDNNLNSSTRRSDGDSETQNRSFTGFLFTPIPTTNPFLSGSVFNLSRPAYIHEAAEEQQQEFVLETVVVGSTAVVSTTVSVGYVAWMLRGGSLLTTFLSSLPVWQSFDPLPVLESFEKDEEDGDEESLASLVAGG